MTVQTVSVGDLEDVARWAQEQGVDPMTYLAADAEALIDEADAVVREARLQRRLREKMRRGA